MGDMPSGRRIVERYLEKTGLKAAQAIVRRRLRSWPAQGWPQATARQKPADGDEQADRISDDGDGEEDSHQHRAEILVVVEEASPVEARRQHAEQAEGRDRDEIPGPRPDRCDQQTQRVQDQQEPKARVDDEKHVAVEDRHVTLCTTPRIFRRVGTWMVVGMVTRG